MIPKHVCGRWCVTLLVGSVMLFVSTAVHAQGTGVVEGSIVAREGGQPVANAAITVEGTSLTASTNANGRFQIRGVTPGRTTLIVKASGFLEQRIPDLSIAAGTPTSVSVELERTPNFMERVQVTATKSELSIGDVAAQTDIVSRSIIDMRGDQTLTQAVAHVPGAVVSTELGIFESVMLRGMPRGDPEFTNTLLLIDGVPQTTSRNGSRVIGLTINDARNIEIVRGPNSALYGRTAIGGSVNILTADPTPTPLVDADFTAGQQGLKNGVARVSGPIKQWGGYYASVGSGRNTGFYTTKTGGDFSQDYTALFGKLTFAPDRKSFGSVSVNRVVSDNSTPTNEPIIDGALLHTIDPRFDRLTNFNIPGPNYHQGESRLTFNYTRQLAPWARMVEVFGYRDVQQQFINDGDFIGSPFDLATNTVEMYPFSQDLNENILYQEFRVELTPRQGRVKNSLIVGGSYDHTAGTNALDFIFTDEENEGIPINYLNPVIPPSSDWSHDVQPTRTYHLGNLGLFGQYLIEPTPRWVFMGGGRYDRMALDNQPEGGSKVEDTFSAFSPKASATYKLLGAGAPTAPAVNLYAAYSHAFLPPRAPSSLTPANVVINLQPEDIDNVEGGAKASLLNNRVSLEGAYFWMKENGVVLSRREGPFFFPTNAGVQRYRGVETSVTAAVTARASAFVNAAFYRSRFGEFVDGDDVLTGNRLPIAPDHIVNVGVTFRPTRSIDATVNVKHTGSVAVDRENTFELDPYALFDAAVTWRRGPLRVTLAGHNLFNTEYYWNGGSETADPGRPRQVLVTFAVRSKLR